VLVERIAAAEKLSPHHAVCCEVLNLPSQVGSRSTLLRLGSSLSRYTGKSGTRKVGVGSKPVEESVSCFSLGNLHSDIY
jgi:hypothetical protein